MVRLHVELINKTAALHAAALVQNLAPVTSGGGLFSLRTFCPPTSLPFSWRSFSLCSFWATSWLISLQPSSPIFWPGTSSSPPSSAPCAQALCGPVWMVRHPHHPTNLAPAPPVQAPRSWWKELRFLPLPPLLPRRIPGRACRRKRRSHQTRRLRRHAGRGSLRTSSFLLNSGCARVAVSCSQRQSRLRGKI